MIRGEWRALLAAASLLFAAGEARAQVSCVTETSGSTSNYVCTLQDCSSYDLAQLSSLVGASLSSPIWIRAWGATGGKGSGVAAADGGDPGDGGYAQTVTTIDAYFSAYGTTVVYFYLGSEGSDEHDGGKGGSSTIVAAADLSANTPCILATSEAQPSPIPTPIESCSKQNVLLIAAGGGGGGQASSDGLYPGGHGGDGGVAISTEGFAAVGAGGDSAGNYQGEDSACGGYDGTAGCAPSGAGGASAQNGIGGEGGPVHIQNGASAPQPWLDAMPANVGSMGVGGEGGHGDAAGGGGGGGFGGGGGGSNGSSLQGTGGGGGGSYAVASTSSTSSAPTSRPSSPSSNGTVQIVFQGVSRTPIQPANTPTVTHTSPPTSTAQPSDEGVGAEAATPTPTSAPTISPTPAPTFLYSSVNDMLNGQRVLADVVDLIVVNPTTSGSSTSVQNILFESSDGGLVSPQIDDDVVTAPCAQSSTPFANPFPQQVRAARLFNTAEDVVVTLAPTTSASGSGCSGSDNLGFYVSDQIDSSNDSTTSAFAGDLSLEGLMLAVADFNQDGFDDLLAFTAESAFTATAANTSEPSLGLSVATPVSLPSAAMAPLGEPVTGDFNGDGLIDVAWIGGDYSGGTPATSVYFATICPGPVPNSICADQASFAILFSPLSSQPIALSNSSNCSALQPAAITVGNFTGDPNVGTPNELMTFTLGSSCLPAATLYEFNGEMQPLAISNATELPAASGFTLQTTTIYATSAVLNVLSAATQAVVAYGGLGTDVDGNVSTVHVVGVVSVDAATAAMTTNITTGSSSNLAPLAGLAVGILGAPPEDDPTTQDYTPQIAILTGVDCAGDSANIDVFDVDPDTLAPSSAGQYPVTGFNQQATLTYANLAGSLLQAGDLQGESVRVGQPVIVTVTSSSQPYIVLGAPPMHVDYIALSGSDPEVVNMSVLPNNFTSQYDTEITSSNQSSSQTTTSYGHAIDAGATESEGYEFDIPVAETASFTQAVDLTYQRTTAVQYNTYSQVEFDASTTTAFYDQVWLTVQEYNIYNYPVIGQTTCAEGSTSPCTEYPLYITLSGPQVTTQENLQGYGVEWYQPVHEVGQVFSYAPNQTLLEARLNDPSLLTSAVSFVTDTSSTSEEVSWAESGGEDQSVGTTTTFSFETDNSVTVGTPLYNIFQTGVQVSAYGNYAENSSTSTLNASVTQVGASGGVVIDKSGLFLEPPLYQYQVSPFVFGQTESASADQSIAIDTDIVTSGLLQTVFAADPTASGAGSWWSSTTSYSTYPDVALNHPARWSYVAEIPSSPPASCLQQDTDVEDGYICMTGNDPDSSDDELWNSEFYWMRGLFVTVGGTTGPQRNTAVVGDDIYLQARIYNYSLTDMPDGATIHVRFYMQPWDPEGEVPAGDSVWINGSDSVIDGLPGFNEASPNWTTVSTSFDTSTLTGDTYWVFWVVTWIEDSSGDLVTEVPGHGLTSTPATDITSISQVPIETVTVTLPDGSKDTGASFTNNVGLYNQVFYLQSATTSAQLEARRRSRRLQRRGVPATDQVDLHLSSSAVELGDKIDVDGLVYSPEGKPDGAFVYFYDGSPGAGGKLFDVELIPPMKAGQKILAKVPYHARVCGPHVLVAIASKGTADEVRSQAPLVVTCRAAETPTATPTATASVPPSSTPTATAQATATAIVVHSDGGGCNTGSGGSNPWSLAPLAFFFLTRRRGGPAVWRLAKG